MSTTDRGHWLMLHPGELIATFLLPLPDPIPIPAGQTLPTYLLLDRSEIDLLRPRVDQLWLRSLDQPSSNVPLAELFLDSKTCVVLPDGDWVADRSSLAQAHTSPSEQPSEPEASVNWSNKVALSSSIQLHHAVTDGLVRAQFGTALDVAHAVGGAMTTADEIAGRIRHRGGGLPGDVMATAMREIEFGAVTVAECAVGLRITVDVPPQVDNVLVTTSAPPAPYGPEEPDRLFPDRVTMWNWRYMMADHVDVGFLERRLRNALTVALSDLAGISRAAQAVRRLPARLPTLERLPAMIPVLLRRFDQIGDPHAQAAVLLMAPHPSLDAWRHPEPFSEEEMSQFGAARGRATDGAFANHVGLHREAQVALHRDGDHRLAALLCGVAAESLLDELLLHLMWEERVTPEAAAQSWRSSLITRVKNDFKHRLGGSWSLTGSQPIGRWEADVAALRHRVAHAAYTPTRDETAASIEAVNKLVTHLCDRLASPATIGRYPRTAIALAGQPGLERRRAYSRRIQRLQVEPTETDWNTTFVRWRESWRRIRRDLDTEPRTPNLAKAHPLAVFHPDSSVRWCLHDRLQHLAVPIDVDATETTSNFTGRAYALAQSVWERSRKPEPLSFSFEGHVPYTIADSVGWVEEYHLVPMTQVMVDRSDYDRPHQTRGPDDPRETTTT